MNSKIRVFLAAAMFCGTCAVALADDTAKDIVLDRIRMPVVTANPGALASQDAMVISVLLESPDGTLTPKGTDTLFRTGDRFRVKLTASRAGKVSLFNTNPRGETNPQPVWQGEVKVGQDTISPRLALTGNSGIDLLHVVFEPPQEPSIFAWLGSWLHRKDSKDIRLDVQNTPTATYLLNGSGQGLVGTVQIVHTPG